MKVDPFPSPLTTSIVPPCWRTIPTLTAKPSPVPFTSDLVVKNGSKIRSRCSGAIPGPVSAKATVTSSAEALRPHGQGSAAGHGLDGIVDDVEEHLLHSRRIDLARAAGHRAYSSSIVTAITPCSRTSPTAWRSTPFRSVVCGKNGR